MKLIILDRDGVINQDSDDYIKSPDEWIPIPGSLAAIARLNQAGYRVAVATNQSGLARGLFSIDELNAIHNKMYQAVADEGGEIEALFFCPHGPDDECECRKPRPGLFYQICKRLFTTLDKVPSIGDSLRDLEAARLAGARPILVRTGKGARTEKDPNLDSSIPVFDDLSQAVDHLLSNEPEDT